MNGQYWQRKSLQQFSGTDKEVLGDYIKQPPGEGSRYLEFFWIGWDKEDYCRPGM